MNTPTPALVPQRAAQRLPRTVLLLFCAAYILPGLVGRDPWRNADITAFGYMLSLTHRGAGEGLMAAIAGVPADGVLLPYALGALSIQLFDGWLNAAFAARIPFALLLAGTAVLTWYSTYHLARTEAARPLPFAFGGEANPVDYARAIADGALLALMATLGLLQLGHETTPELAQLFATSLFLYAMATSASNAWRSRGAMLASLTMLSASGAPVIGLGLAVAGVAVSLRSSYPLARASARWIVGSAIVAAAVAALLNAWAWRISPEVEFGDLLTLLAWFTWPLWPMALWTLWQWRAHLLHRHIAVPLTVAAVAIVACATMGALDRALMLGLPALAALAAFALPTLKRSLSAAIDWFSVAFFSAFAVAIWVVYAAMLTGTPAKTASNVARLLPGFIGSFNLLALALAVAGMLAWLWLVRWRTGRHQHALWKSLVLPAGGVTLCWLLAMTLLLPALNYARSYRPLVDRLAQHVPQDACIVAVGLRVSQLAALEYHGGWRVEAPATVRAATERGGVGCEFLLTRVRSQAASDTLQRPGWLLLARERLPTDRNEQTAVYRRVLAEGAAR